MKSVDILLIFFIVLIVRISCSHFRGSMITWRVINSTSNPLVVEILQRHAWNYTWWPCTNTHISAGNYMIGSGSIVCPSSCPPNVSTLSSVTVPCTGYNQIESYVSGEGRFTFRVAPNYRFRAVFTSSAWFSLVTGGGTWSVSTEINTYIRPNGRYNQAPIVTMLPVIRLRRYLSYNIKINVADNDFDRYTCIWSNTSQECGGICRSALNLPASTFLNETSCILHFVPAAVGFYAVAFTVLDFENDTSTTSLSRVPIQFIFNVWDSNVTCSLKPIYIGDAPADQCIFVEPGQNITMFIRIKIQCPNATLANVIGVYPAGFTQSTPFTDPYDTTIYSFKVSYTGNANQVGQNLFCFAGVDSIGNQGDSNCLRFTVQLAAESRNTLYINNATHFPTGLVSKYQSNWTLIYPTGTTFVRPSTEALIRFKITSTQQDFVTYNVVKQTTNVNYLSDRLIISSTVVFNPGQNYYISIDPGVFLPISTCLRDSMGITDKLFWPFNTASEPSTTVTTTTTSRSSTTTLLNRTVPTLRTFITQTTQTTQTKTTTFLTTTTSLSTTIKQIHVFSSFPISGIVGIIVGSLILITLISSFIIQFKRRAPANLSTESNTTSKKKSMPDILQQYRIATRTNKQTARRSVAYLTNTLSFNSDTQQTLVSIEC
ncbi:unnamed protein product [Rotaria sordida]|uniref:Uncharacterized protein n=1 Tax=Rotaria sordida TaxID=392033 RepID=A0A813WWQ2_9BILA|nr:unnamed protein product [Rotaria sordida]